MMRWLVLFLFLVVEAQEAAGQNDTSTATCDTAAFHLTPQGSCKDCEDCPKECDPTDDHYKVFPTSDCDGMASSEGGGQDSGGGDGQCDTTVYHVNPQGGCRLCGSNCPPECNPESDKYQVYTSADCDGNGSTEGGGGGGGDDEGGEEEGTTTDQAGTPADTPTDAPKDDTSGAMQRDSMVAFMEVLIVSLPLLMLYWPFENQ